MPEIVKEEFLVEQNGQKPSSERASADGYLFFASHFPSTASTKFQPGAPARQMYNVRVHITNESIQFRATLLPRLAPPESIMSESTAS